MQFDKQTVRQALLTGEEALFAYSLPTWEDFPTLPLYMDQVIYLLNGYLSLTPGREEGTIVTPAMINNYVKLKIIPPPVKKRYGRVHLAYLVMVCVLKQSISIGDIKKLLPVALPEEEVRASYAAFVRAGMEVKADFSRAMRQAAAPVLAADGPPVTDLIFRTAVAANLFRLTTQQMVILSASGRDGPGDK